MINSEALDLIKKFEGFSAKPYLCPAGKPTIGYGATFYPDGRLVTLKDSHITKEEASRMLQMHVDEFSHQVLDCLKYELNDNQFGAVVSLVYTIGIGNFKKSTLLKLLNTGTEEAMHMASAQFAKWNKIKKPSGYVVVRGLTNRRKAEAELFLKPALVVDNKPLKKKR